jgi:hypothetical protein
MNELKRRPVFMKTIRLFFFLLLLPVVSVVLSSCQGGSSADPRVISDITFFHAGSGIPITPDEGTLRVYGYVEIRVLDQNGDVMETADAYVTYDKTGGKDDPPETLLERNDDGLLVVDPTGHFRITVRAGDITGDYLLDTSGLIVMDPNQPGDFDGDGAFEISAAAVEQGSVSLEPGKILGNVPDGVELVHILYLVGPRDDKVEKSRVPYGGTFALDLSDYTDVTRETTYVFKNTLAVVYGGTIVYETALSLEATLLVTVFGK